MHDEFRTAISYLILQTRSKLSNANASPPSEGEAESASNGEFWVDDVWTKEDEDKAEEMLRSHEEKCTISSLTMKGFEKKGPKGVDGIAWNKFYQDHGTRFFKDRHYFSKAFPNEFGTTENPDSSERTLVEIGCGVGNACLPLLENATGSWKTIHALDISAEAVDLLRRDERFVKCNENTKNSGRSVHGHVCDIGQSFPTTCIGVSDVTTLLFCLSALDPDDMPKACGYVASSLKPGGVLVFRDYGRYDEAQMKLGTSRNKRIKDNFYRKHDGTKCYYFSLEDLERLFVGAGLKPLELKCLRRAYGNKSSGEIRRRVWVQARFVRPTD